MYLYLGQSRTVPCEDVVGIFDLDNASWSYRTRAFLEHAQKTGQIVSTTEDFPRSFVVCQKGERQPKVYLSSLSSGTLKGRMEQSRFEEPKP